MKPKYCYWSVCDGPYGAMMEHCVRTARQAGVFKEFHILCDRLLEGCECYDAYQIEKDHGLFKLHYLKVGMSRLNFEWFVWLDADTVFLRNPANVLAPVGRSPIHVPLEANLTAWKKSRETSKATTDRCEGGSAESNPDAGESGTGVEAESVRLVRLHEIFRQEGVANQVYLSGSSFWIVHHDAIEAIYDCALGFWHKAKEAGETADVSAALGYAMQIFCGNPESHLLHKHPEVWVDDRDGFLANGAESNQPWLWRDALSGGGVQAQPAIVHVPWRRRGSEKAE